MTEPVTLVPLSLTVAIDPNSLPQRPCSHVGALRDFKSSRHGPKSTQSLAFEPSGIKQTVEVGSLCRVRVMATGIVGHNMTGAIVSIGVARDGVMLYSDAALAACRINGPLDFDSFVIDVPDEDVPQGVHEYELYFSQTSGTSGSTGYLGRRGQDLAPGVDTVISLEVLDP